MKITRRSLFAMFTAPLLRPENKGDIVSPLINPADDAPADRDSAEARVDHYRHAWKFCKALKQLELAAIKEKYPRTWKRLQFSGVCLYGYGAAIVYGTGVPSHSKAEVRRMKALFGPRVVAAYRTTKGRVWVAMVKGESVAAIRAEIEAARRKAVGAA